MAKAGGMIPESGRSNNEKQPKLSIKTALVVS